MKIIQFFLSLFFVLLIIVVSLLSFLGFVPFLSDLVGAKYKDFGIKYDKTDYQNLLDKISGKNEIRDSFSQEELSAALGEIPKKYLPVENIQMKVNKDSTVEISANLLTKNLFSILFPKKTSWLKYIKLLKNPPVYVKTSIATTQKKLDLKLHKIEIGRVALPIGKIKIDNFITGFFNSLISKTPGVNFEMVTFAEGQIIFQGTLPWVGP